MTLQITDRHTRARHSRKRMVANLNFQRTYVVQILGRAKLRVGECLTCREAVAAKFIFTYYPAYFQ